MATLSIKSLIVVLSVSVATEAAARRSHKPQPRQRAITANEVAPASTRERARPQAPERGREGAAGKSGSRGAEAAPQAKRAAPASPPLAAPAPGRGNAPDGARNAPAPQPALEKATPPPQVPAKPEPAATAPVPQEPPAAWTADDIIRGRGECMARLAPIVAEIEPLPPLHEARCGLPSPVLLKSIGANSKVSIAPPAVVDCRIVVALHDWLDRVVQPAARRVLDTEIVQITSAGGYQCRNRAGNEKISAHAAANAIDVLGFRTRQGRSIEVAKSWQPAAPQRPAPTASPPPPADDRNAGGLKPNRQRQASRSLANANAPQKQDTPPAKAADESPDAKFLKEIHASACVEFSTVLGPDANRDHWDHFHLDLEWRRRGAHYCR